MGSPIWGQGSWSTHSPSANHVLSIMARIWLSWRCSAIARCGLLKVCGKVDVGNGAT